MNERDYHDQHYEADAARIQRTPLFEHVHERAARRFLRDTGAGRAHRILSLGCGDGSIERRLAPYVGEIVGLDISPVAVEQARANCQWRNVSFVVSQSDRLQLEALGQFDYIAAFAFLHHLDDGAIRHTFAAARAVVRRGGAFYSYDPSRRRLVARFAGFVRAAYEHYHSPDERELDAETLASLAVEAGFSSPVIGYSDYFLGPLAWLAPDTPKWLAGPLEALDNALLAVPLLRSYASSFSLFARAA